MIRERAEVLAVIDANQDITGVLSYKNILSAYKTDIEQNSAAGKHPEGGAAPEAASPRAASSWWVAMACRDATS